jgi:type 1 glutamine amidotransferase
MVKWSRIISAILTLGAAACSSDQSASSSTPASSPVSPSPSPVSGGTPIRVLMLTATAGFRHDSIAAARDVMMTVATGELTVTATEDLAAIGPSTLAAHDVLMFALTSGELAFSADQKAAIVDFVSGGGGFVGVHSATDTLYEWPEYGRLVGAYFKEHPWTQQGSLIVEDGSHPATAGLGERFSILEEFYTFRDNPRPRVQVLVRLDAASVGSTGDYPIAWAHSYGSGRGYYNALGHFPETWRDQRFQRQLTGAIRWAAKR